MTGGYLAWFYARNVYRWSTKASCLFALGGIITGYGAMIDVWSRMGEYTRNWKTDLEKGIYIVPWNDINNDN